MMTSDLREFTRMALEKGLERDKIASALSEAGWPEDDIRAALGAFADVAFPLPVPKPRVHFSARDAFIYLLLFSALYASVWHLIALIFKFIDRLMPDRAQNTLAVASDAAIRWDIAVLLVLFPLFLYMFALSRRMIARDPALLISGPRKWLTYLTLFIGAVVLASDLVVLVNSLLAGGLTLPFVLKVITVGVIAGGVFGTSSPTFGGTSKSDAAAGTLFDCGVSCRRRSHRNGACDHRPALGAAQTRSRSAQGQRSQCAFECHLVPLPRARSLAGLARRCPCDATHRS